MSDPKKSLCFNIFFDFDQNFSIEEWIFVRIMSVIGNFCCHSDYKDDYKDIKEESHRKRERRQR